jgi:exonuclease VII small subunit
MLNIAQAGINNFASDQEATAPPSEEIFVLSSSQLEAIIAQAIERATAPLAARLDALERGVRCGEGGEEDLKELRSRLEDLEELRPWTEALSKKVARLEAPRISQKTEARAEKIAKYLKERPDHKATFETLRGHLGVDKDLLNDAVKVLLDESSGLFAVIKSKTGDKRKRSLIMLPR